MRRKLLLCAWAVLALMPCTMVRAEDAMTVQRLRGWCKPELSQSCLAYVACAGDVLHSRGFICHPGVTYGALAQVFVNWADKHPEHWGDSTVDGVITALSETWPCPAK
jgi:hypothetical protein